jgi:hypothetical protein
MTLTYDLRGQLLLPLRFINRTISLLSILDNFDEQLSNLSYHHQEAHRIDQDLVIEELFRDVLREAIERLYYRKRQEYDELAREYPVSEVTVTISSYIFANGIV